jgi:DNA-directed RNA polymerase specialized sigma24 family protein
MTISDSMLNYASDKEPNMNDAILCADVARALDELPGTVYGEVLPRLRSVLADNLQRGRVTKFQTRNPGHTPADYVRRVADNLRLHGEVPDRLAAGSESEWQALSQAMTHRAYHRLLEIGIEPAVAQDRARDLAQKTCLNILQAQPYPYDVPYAAWATRILYNSIAQETQRSRDVMDRRDRLPLERWPADGEGDWDWADPSAADEAEHCELRQTLSWALNQLSPKQRTAVVRRVYDAEPDRLTALALASSEQAVQNHRHRGMHRLRQLLAAG